MRPPYSQGPNPDTNLHTNTHHPNNKKPQSKFQTTLNQFFCPQPSYHPILINAHTSPVTIPICPNRNSRTPNYDEDTLTDIDSSDDSSSEAYSKTLNRKLRQNQLASAKRKSLPSTATKPKSLPLIAVALWQQLLHKRAHSPSRK